MTENKVERTPLYTFCRRLFGLLFHTICPVRYRNTQVLDKAEGPYILIANHLTMVDPFVLALPTKRYEIRFVGKRELSSNKLLGWIVTKLHMIPVSRHATDMSAMRACMQALREGKVLGIFPEGTRHLPEMMETVESGAAMIALRAGVPLIPIYLNGKVRPFRTVRVTIGEPMDLTDLREKGVNNDTVQELCQRIRETFYALRAADNQAK